MVLGVWLGRVGFHDMFHFCFNFNVKLFEFHFLQYEKLCKNKALIGLLDILADEC